MWLTVILVTITLLIMILTSLLSWLSRLRTLPPGPLPIPFYGNRMPEDVHPGLCEWYKQLREKYGNIFTVYQGNKPTIVVNGFNAVNELLINNGSVVHTRPSGQGILSFLHDDAGLVWNNNSYKSIRKISSIALKSFISAHNLAETTSNDKLTDLLDQLSGDDASTVDISNALRDMVSENICTMLFGLENQQKFGNVMALHYHSLASINKINHVMRIPLLKYIPGFKSGWKNSVEGKELFKQFLREELQEHTEKFPSDKICEDFFDTFIRHNRSQKVGHLGEEDCSATVMQLMLAGLDAVHGSLMWLFLYISIHPDIQNKMFEEINSELGMGAMPTTKHMNVMPYCMAVIYETLRISNVAFTSLPYTNQQEITIENTTIPAHSSIIVNLVSINKDPDTFPEPNAFIPERFIDKDGKLQNITEFSPFSIGRRACLGESFSKSSIFITMVQMLQRYQLCTVENETYSTESTKSFLSTPNAYKLRYIQRTEDSVDNNNNICSGNSKLHA